MTAPLYQGPGGGATWRRLFALLAIFVAGTALHLVEHLARGLTPLVAWTALPAVPLGLLALWGSWRRTPWGAGLALLLAVAALVFGALEHLILPGPDHLARAPLPSAALTGFLLLLAPVVGLAAWRALHGRHRTSQPSA
ncbi:MAG: hypothetical protein HYV61_04330 [Candidatus Rokubacteria bacterium]|nr:hypothetical protein [Candidatus Rokubacteria bacterium]